MLGRIAIIQQEALEPKRHPAAPMPVSEAPGPRFWLGLTRKVKNVLPIEDHRQVLANHRLTAAISSNVTREVRSLQQKKAKRGHDDNQRERQKEQDLERDGKGVNGGDRPTKLVARQKQVDPDGRG